MADEQHAKRMKRQKVEAHGWEQHFKEQTLQLNVGSAAQARIWEQQQDNPLICNVLLLPNADAAGPSAAQQHGVRVSGAVLAERSAWFLALAGHVDDLPSGTRCEDGCLAVQVPISVPEGVLKAVVAAMHSGMLVLSAADIMPVLELADAMQAEAILQAVVGSLSQQVAAASAPPVLGEFALQLLLRLSGLAANAAELIGALLCLAIKPAGSVLHSWRLPKEVQVSAGAVDAAVAAAGPFQSHTRVLLLAALHDRPDILQHVDWQRVAPPEARALVRIMRARGLQVPACAAWLECAASERSGWRLGKAQYDVVEYCCDSTALREEFPCFGVHNSLRFENGMRLYACCGTSSQEHVAKLAVSCLEASAAGVGWLSTTCLT